MRRCKRLRRLRTTLKQRLDRLERRLTNVSGSAAHPERDVIVSYVAIEALNAWGLFSRSYYLSCVLGARTERKKKVTLTLPPADPLGFAIAHYKPRAQPNAGGVWHRRDEPPWHDPNVLMTLCGNMGCSIQPQINAAFSLNQNVFKDLPVFRNFFAHRNGQTAEAARRIALNYTLASSLSPAELLLSVSPGMSASVIVDWLSEINITADFLCKA